MSSRLPGVLEEEAAREAWAGEVDGLRPATTCRPSSPHEVAEVVRIAHQEGLAITPVGGGTLLHLGNIPGRADVALLLDGVQDGLDHSPEDLVATVPAGASVGRVNEQLAAAGQRLPLDPPFPDRATIGGTLAALPIGPRMLSLGRPRDGVLGLQVILPDGTETKTGGRVVKNVTGYDLTKLHLGALGTLGVLVGATFKLHPLPEEQVTLALAFPNLDGALRTAADVQKTGLAPSALVAVNAPVGAALSAPVQPGGLVMEFAGEPAVVARQERTALELAAVREALQSQVLRGAPAQELWEEIARFPVESWSLGIRASLPAGHVEAYADAAPDVLFAAGLGGGLLAHVHLGEVFVGVESPPDQGVGRGIVGELTSLATSLGGHLRVERAPLPVKRELDVWGPRPGAFELFVRVKATFDPSGVLNPGRFIGGL